uniref:Uncharacterized protein n=1 Tax=Aegilops tauschii subsp. strangulata TaxID=200361 RepID=A0A453P9S3_AEGTS
ENGPIFAMYITKSMLDFAQNLFLVYVWMRWGDRLRGSCKCKADWQGSFCRNNTPCLAS